MNRTSMRSEPGDDGILAYVEETAPDNRPDTPSSRRPRDLVISLLVLLVPMLLLVGGYQLLAGRTEAVPVDQSAQIIAARDAGMEVREPAGLDDDWVPVSAAFRAEDDGDTLRLGYITPDGEPVQVVQSTRPTQVLITGDLGEDSAPRGPVEVAGVAWQSYPGRAGEQALLHKDGDHTVLVVGPTTEAELVDLAASLR